MADEKRLCWSHFKENFRKISLHGNSFSHVDSKLLSLCLNQMQKVKLSMTKFSHCQIFTFFQNLNLTSRIKQLKIENQDLTILTENVLCDCIAKLQKVKFINIKLSKSQKRAIRIKYPKNYSNILISKHWISHTILQIKTIIEKH